MRRDTILARILAAGGKRDPVTEDDLSSDRITGVTDQNHVGGRRFVLDLAAAARIRAADRVLDLGCGLGGSARVLAAAIGCRVDGLDLTAERVRDANALTRLVGLHDLVRVRHADWLTARVTRGRYDVLWGQAAWLHVEDKARLFERWRPALRTGGRVAFEDACLLRPHATAAERRLLAALERDWHSTMASADDWVEALAAGGFVVVHRKRLDSAFRRDHRWLTVVGPRQRPPAPALELRASRNAVRAADLGLIGYLRLVAIPATQG